MEKPLSLPDLPKLPDFPDLEEEERDSPNQLPRFPSNSIGDKFSQDTIKKAVTGKKEEEGAFDADEFDLPDMDEDEEDQMMQEPLTSPMTREISEELPMRRTSRRTEPVFIRLDKFEEALKIFDKAKAQISEIERMLRDIKRVKDKEEQELTIWEKEMQSIKSQIDRIDNELFSKVE